RLLGPLGAEARRRAILKHPWRALGNRLRRMGRQVRLGCWPEGGLDIVFLGVDGAGKSSVIRAVREQLGGAFACSIFFSFSPWLALSFTLFPTPLPAPPAPPPRAPPTRRTPSPHDRSWRL